MKIYQRTPSKIRRRVAVAICLGCLTSHRFENLTYAAPPVSSKIGGKRPTEEQSNSEIQKTYQQPRIRYVLGTKAIVRSGPSDRYYATHEIPAGSRVEVHLETTDGWSGIRPPVNSYNWVSAKSTYILPGGKVAEVAEDDTPAWVGTESKDVTQLMWQTALVKSQQLQILGEEYQIGTDGAKQLWYRISPPQGEFRWVRSSALTDQVPATNIAPPQTAKSTVANQIAQASYSTPVGSGVTQAAAQDISIGDPVDGQIVWSDESEVVARINQEIRNEQSEIMGQLPTGTNIDDALITEDESMVMGAMPVESVMTPQELQRAKRRQQARHQIDSFQHWDNLQNSSQGTFNAKPLGSILGLVGLGIIETERAPANTPVHPIARRVPMHDRTKSMPMQYGSSRLDRLPRPGQRPDSLGRTKPYDDTDSHYYDDTLGSNRDRTNGIMDSQRPIMERLLSSNQPLFGSDQPKTPEWNPRQDLASNPPMTREWHGIQSPRIQPVSVAMQNAFDEPLEDAKFSTPELQRTLLELSEVVSRPTEDWELGRLRARCLDWIDTGDSAIVRGEARLLLERVERFEELRIKTLQSLQNNGYPNGMRDTMLASQPGPASQPGFSPSSYSSSNGQTAVVPASAVRGVTSNVGPIANPIDSGAGDASGWLVQVHATVPGQPEYALTDDAGNVITYVRSTASLNLRRYLQQPVMIQGVRGYIPALAAKQIVAERVVRLR
jgi:uncharacterized protein YgiM (DUF1202 family)